MLAIVTYLQLYHGRCHHAANRGRSYWGRVGGGEGAVEPDKSILWIEDFHYSEDSVFFRLGSI